MTEPETPAIERAATFGNPYKKNARSDKPIRQKQNIIRNEQLISSRFNGEFGNEDNDHTEENKRIIDCSHCKIFWKLKLTIFTPPRTAAETNCFPAKDLVRDAIL